MTRLLITSGQAVSSDQTADVVFITSDYGPTPVRSMANAWVEFDFPVVLISGVTEFEGGNLARRIAEGHRKSRLGYRVQFLEKRAAVVAGVRFISSHHANLNFILSALSQPHEGPTVIVTYEPPPEDVSAVMQAGKVARWIYPASTSEPLIVEI